MDQCDLVATVDYKSESPAVPYAREGACQRGGLGGRNW